MGVSRRRYASMRGVSDMAVRKAIASGRISVEADGTIDPEKADAEFIITNIEMFLHAVGIAKLAHT